MADGVDIDLYADDLEQDFAQAKDDFGGDGVDLYDDVISAPSASDAIRVSENNSGGSAQIDRVEVGDSNGGYHHVGNNLAPNHIGRRHQLYVGNLTWWTTDQDITDAVMEIGVPDFQEVKFFENRSNGQSKGFCVISLGSESSMRLCMDRLPKKELHGQSPMVTLPTKQALNQFESQQKTRPNPPVANGPRGLLPNMGGPPQMGGPNMGGGQHSGPPPGHQPRMMNPGGPPGHMRGPSHMSQNMPPGHPGQPGMPRMQVNNFGPPMHQSGGCQMNQPMQQGPPRFPNQGPWNGPPRANGPPRPGPPPGPTGPQQHRPPQMFQGLPGAQLQRGPRPDWNRPPMHGGGGGGFPQGPPPGHPQQHMQGPPRGPPPIQMGGPPGPPHGPPQGPPAPHVNPAFFNQGGGGGGPPQHPSGPPLGPPHGQQQNMSPHPPPPHFGQPGAPRGPWTGTPGGKPPGPPFPEQGMPPQLSEVEFEEIMTRNRTVSSSAIARAVSDAAAGEYASAIETLVTAISLIKQSKVAHDERCKILISSLQDTLHGIENKSYSRRERSRSRERSHRRPRRERSSSRYRERSRDRERERERDRDGRYYSDSYREATRDGRDRSRSRERERAAATEHYRDESSSRSGRPRKSPEPPSDPVNETSKRNYYEERYRSSDRERDRERERDRREEHRSRH